MVRIDHNIESYAAIKIISIPADESEVDTLRSEGLNINATRTYFQGIVDDFVGEIQLMESMKGIQNVVSVEDYKVIEKTDKIGWDIYIRMELLIPFNTYICDKKLTEQEIIKIGSDICTALEICSKRNIIHRDIKPENMFINDLGYFKLGDFGIARKLENMTGSLSQKGTFNYMAPEVTNRIDYDARVDIYSIGIVLYRLLNGNRLPFLDSEKQLLNPNERRNAIERRIRGEALPVPCDASPAMANLILRACAFDPNKRFSSATEMKQALIDVSNGTYQVVDMNLDKTTSVRQPLAGYDKTTSVRKAQIHDDKTAHSINTFGNMPRKKSNLLKIISAILAVAIIAGVGIFVVPKFINNKNETNEVSTSDTSKSSNFDEEQISSIISEAEKLAAVEDYEGALNKVQDGLVTYPESEEYTSSLNKKIKEENLTKASDLAEKGGYETAMSLIKSAQSTYGSDPDYDKAYETYEKGNALKKAEEYAGAGDYVSAIKTITNIQQNNATDPELISANNRYSASYAAELSSNADLLISEGKYDDAIGTIKEGMKVIPDNEDLKNKLNELESAKPVSLSDIEAFNGGWTWNDGAPIDPFNNDYSSSCNYAIFEVNGINQSLLSNFSEGYRWGSSEYHTDGKYKLLTMQLAPYTTMGKDGDEYVQIYADSKLVYTSPIINRKTEVFQCEVDISEAKYIEIRIICYYGNSYGGGVDGDDSSLILSNAQLWPEKNK